MSTRTESGAAHAGRMPRFERRVLGGSLLVAAPGLLGALALAWWPPSETTLRWAWLVAMAAATAGLARWQYRRVVFPLYTLAGLLEALREGDYSLRGVAGGVLGDVVYDLNALAERLQQERLDFEESSHLLGKTLAALDSAVMVFDERSRLRLLNPAAQRLLDGERHKLFGLTAAELGLAGLLEGPADRVAVHAFPGRSGRFQLRHAALRAGGRGGRLLVVNDVGRVLREEERAAWQRLLRVLGHEVNNSLAPIQSMAGTLATLVAREPLPEDWREDFRGGLDLIGNRAGALARFLAGYSRLARLPPPQRVAFDLGELIGKVARLVPAAGPARLQITVEAGEPLAVVADADQLEQALINLIGNAVEAARAEVRVRWRRDGECACIEIEDDGEGPPPSDNLFVPFFTTKPGGSGIGLALARQIAEGHDGGVSLAPREDGHCGARARLWLPLTPVASPG
ncbi:sensor histidine kinase [Fulvimonas yonginensis]|uniref:histidine kinase n=1 Tax=Fulvimonas yonginensis TaxID=1495200 RepID=A0ABU8J933_9GAMM